MNTLPVEAGLLYQPGGIAVRSGHILVADSGNHRVVAFDEAGKTTAIYGAGGSNLGEYMSPKSTCMQDDKTAFIADVGNKRLCRLDLSSRVVTEVDGGFYIFDVAASPGYIAYTGKRTATDSLVIISDDSGPIRGIGTPLGIVHEFESVFKTVNAVKIACNDEYLAVAFPALALVRVYSLSGGLVVEFFIDSSSVYDIRTQAWESMLNVPDPVLRDMRLAIDPITRQTILDDLLSLARPDRFGVPIYIADIGLLDSHVFVLVGDTLHEFDLGGTEVGSYGFVNESGEKIYVFTFAVDDRGWIWAADSVHTHNIYHSDSAGWRQNMEDAK